MKSPQLSSSTGEPFFDALFLLLVAPLLSFDFDFVVVDVVESAFLALFLAVGAAPVASLVLY